MKLAISGRYRLILCDIWGCLHDGVRIFAPAAALLRTWRSEGRTVLLMTNAPRPASAVARQLGALGLGDGAHDAIITSGDTGIERLRGRQRLGFIGTSADLAVLREAGLDVGEDAQASEIVCTGLIENRPTPEDHDDLLAGMLARGAILHCFNPDRMVLRGGISEPCAGALAERYRDMGGATFWYGKPHAPIYERALGVAAELAGRSFAAEEILVVGDGLATDAAGAAACGYDFLFVTHGIDRSGIEAEGLDERLRRFAAETGKELRLVGAVSELA